MPPAEPEESRPAGNRVLGAAWLSGLPLVVNAISMLANFYIIPGLGEDAWGVWSTAVGLSGATSFLTGLGIRPLFIRALARTRDPADRRRLIGSQLALRIALALLASTIALSIGLALHYDRVILLCALIASIGLIPSVMWTVYGDVLNADEAFKTSAIASLVSGLVLTAATVVVVAARLGPVGVAGAYLIGPVLTALQMGRHLRRRGLRVLPLWDPVEIRRLIREARMTAAGDGVGNLLTRLNGVYVPALVGHIAYGFYATGVLLFTRLQIIGDALVTAYTPGVSREHATLGAGQPTWSSRTLQRLLLVSGVTLGVAALGASGWFTGLVYREADQSAARHAALLVMAIASVALPLIVVAMGWRQLLIAVDQHDLAARTSAKAATLGAVATVALTWRYGITGAALGLVANAAGNAGLVGLAAHRRIGAAAAVPGWRRGALAWLVGAAVAALAAGRGVTLGGAGLMVAAPLVAGGMLIVTRVVTGEDVALWLARIGSRWRRPG